MSWIIRIGLLLLVLAASGPAQTLPEKVAEPVPVEEPPPDKKQTLSSLLATREGLRKALEEARQKLRNETAETSKKDLQTEIERLEKRRQEVERDFAVMVTGLQSLEDYSINPVSQAPLKLQDELGQFLTPIFSDLRELTRKPREVRALQDELSRLDSQKEQAKRALDEVDKLLADIKASKSPDAGLRTELNETRKRWQTRLGETESRITVVQHQLKELTLSGANFWSELGKQVQRFVFTRGTNIALALLAFLVVLFGLRAAYYYALKLVPVKKYQRLSFSARLLDVVHEGGSLLLAIVSALLVLYARGDWLLGGLALLAVGGLLMTAKSGIGKHLEELQFLLNLGSVREGERVYVNGVPWRVGAIHMFTQLTNVAIGGPGLRLPLAELSKMVSRPSSLDEPWFPCSKRSWILLNGTTLAQVTDITPDQVELRYGGGLKRSLPISDFVKLDVACLAGGFARSVTVGFDFQHQPQALTEIPEKLKADVRAALLESMREEELLDVVVEFQEAAASSLNFLIVAVVAGSQAAHYLSIPRVLQRAALASATRHGWDIPFPQMVVRQAGSSAQS
ncbi:prefoldin subunit 5 [Prosthecobacter dejongeii]|uniref:Prefoldin subunit 5 n=1 Tax=Prosthecobacter dejongeii TaxID=48465 RepID=A0A7W7YIZ7_9BACT|nr:prefoldin subunit 5 [Prosthecobacter dejongeii]